MIHGLGLSGRYFTPVARRLAADGHTVVVPDLPGTVRSRAAVRTTPGTEELASSLGRWYAAAGLGPCLLVGHSVGCQVAAAFAARHPEFIARVLLTGPALEPGASAWRQLGRLLADAPREPWSLLFLAVSDYLTTGPVRFLSALRGALRDAEGAFEARLRVIDVPALVVRGSGDPLAPAAWAERVAALLPKGGAAVVEDAAHAAHFSAPDRMAALITTFLSDPAPSSSDRSASARFLGQPAESRMESRL
ncbi:alpha/beta fold hydrolase [Streptomyces sp. NPDC046261]|uniref:alpha/beta fold hydrolase n=1 Tax=Streptomyces sp. NPDC046261 TaxID=3157200 RepID=UPI0033FC4E12